MSGVQAFADRVHERKLLNLMVNCDHSSQGCTWKGELRHLQVIDTRTHTLGLLIVL